MTNGDAQERVVVMELSQVEIREQIIRLEGRIDVIEAKVDGIGERVDDVVKRMDRLETRMDRLEAKMDRLLYFLIAFTFVNVGTMAAGFWAVVSALSN